MENLCMCWTNSNADLMVALEENIKIITVYPEGSLNAETTSDASLCVL